MIGNFSRREFFVIEGRDYQAAVREAESPGFSDEHFVMLKDGTPLTMTRGLRELQERLRSL